METPIWLQLIGILASPAMFLIFLMFFNSRINDTKDAFNGRIDDLRAQMEREHDALAKKVDNLDKKIDEKFDRLLYYLSENRAERRPGIERRDRAA